MDSLLVRDGIPTENKPLAWIAILSFNVALIAIATIGLPHVIRAWRFSEDGETRKLLVTKHSLEVPFVLLEFTTARQLLKSGKPRLIVPWLEISSWKLDCSSDEAEHIRLTTVSGRFIKFYVSFASNDRERLLEILNARIEATSRNI